ncbi:MAG: phenylalanine--tRNA ligase subunit beta [Dehalococcoidia bacterium]|nr:phenylalanine--tRNA ligase subunit beta [Dehalococcoidia bacterium]
MKISLNWLKEYVDITLPVDELAHRLSMSGTEVGGVTHIGGMWDRDKVLVGQIVRLDQHPNADRLRLATIDIGGEQNTVVCGAWNIAEGDKVPYARVGARLIDGHSGEPAVLKSAKIRGVTSEGMICSEKELGIGEDHTGIMVLPEDAPVGASLLDYMGDVILDLDLTPNRPDCLAVLGIAREVAAITGRQVREPSLAYSESGESVSDLASVEILDPDLCPRYCASVVTGVKIGLSPRWMQQRLMALGMRPINNVVDITNYVMLEYGQPLHAFDYDRLVDHHIIVRRARPGEKMTTLDGLERDLTEENLLICDGGGSVALAGVMGGLDSEVTESTVNVLIESANFNNISIRRTSARLHLRSEASLRFDKGLSPELPMYALKRATQLMVELCGGSVAQGVIDIYTGKTEPASIHFSAAQVNRILGADMGLGEIEGVLKALGFECTEVRKGTGVEDPRSVGAELSVTPPYWRTDVRIVEDIAEEVARIVGYDNLPMSPLSGSVPRYEPDLERELREKVRNLLVDAGLQEVLTYSWTSLVNLGKLSRPEGLSGQPLKVFNPMSLEQEYLRTTLRAGLLSTLALNERHYGASSVNIFEVGSVFMPTEGDLPREQMMAAGIMTGDVLTKSWDRSATAVDFYDVKGVIDALMDGLGMVPDYSPVEDGDLLAGRTAAISITGSRIGVFGEVHPQVLERFDASSRPVYLFEIDLAAVFAQQRTPNRYQSIPRFPDVVEDLAVVVDTSTQAQMVMEIIMRSPIVSSATLFDIYEGPQVPPGKKSLAYSITYRAPDRTLTGEEVASIRSRIISQLERELGGTLRS